MTFTKHSRKTVCYVYIVCMFIIIQKAHFHQFYSKTDMSIPRDIHCIFRIIFIILFMLQIHLQHEIFLMYISLFLKEF